MSLIEHDPAEKATKRIEEMLRDEIAPLRPNFLRPPAPQPEPEPVAHPEPEHDIVKIDHTLLPLDALEEVSKALMHGKVKYEEWLWVKQPHRHNDLLAKALRHIFEFQKGNDIDPKSGLQHIACAICDLMFLQSNVVQGKGTDDRFKR
jgi:Domain of unknown function (DUF5664)